MTTIRQDLSYEERDVTSWRPPWSAVRWSSIFLGAVVAIGLQYLMMSLWNALAFTSQVAVFADNLAWWQAATSVVVLFIGGALAGWLVGRSGAGRGLLHGLAVWGLLVTGSVVFGFRSAFPLTDLATAGSQAVTTQPGSYWPTFVAFGLGALAAAVGGVVGGLVPSPGEPQRAVARSEPIDLRDDRREVAQGFDRESRPATPSDATFERDLPSRL